MEEKVILIACEMIKKEVEAAIGKTGFAGDIVWMEKGLHEYPEKLKVALQEEVDKWDESYDKILLAYGLCGNGVLGLTSRHAALVIPKFDDCIRCLLSLKEKEPILSDAHAMFYTAEWMDLEDSLLSSQNKYFERYGEKKAIKALKLMFANYRCVKFVETGLYDIDEAYASVKDITDRIGLEFETTPGSLRVYEKMLAGWLDEEFVVTKPGDIVTEKLFADRLTCVFE